MSASYSILQNTACSYKREPDISINWFYQCVFIIFISNTIVYFLVEVRLYFSETKLVLT